MQCTASGVRTTSGRVAREERGDDCIAWLVAPVYYAAAQARLAFRLAWSHTSRLEQSFRAAQENILTDKGRKPSSFAMRVARFSSILHLFPSPQLTLITSKMTYQLFLPSFSYFQREVQFQIRRFFITEMMLPT